MKYSDNTPTDLRSVIWSAIGSVPILDEWSDMRKIRQPGYYELSFLDRGGYLKPVFFDYLPGKIFTFPEMPARVL